jgi:hypothetical protein
MIYRELDDSDEMPFGKHKGKRMEDVPASYLHWLWFNGLKQETDSSQVADYIERNLSALQSENPDLIW